MPVDFLLGSILFTNPFSLPGPAYYYAVKRQNTVFLCLVIEHEDRFIAVYHLSHAFDVDAIKTDGIAVEQYECAA